MAELFDAMARYNTVLIDYARDVWGYIALGTTHLHALLWSGDASTVVDLHPAGYTDSRITAITPREFRVRHVGPSHTTEDLVVFDPRTGALFAGDVVFRGRIPFVGQADSRRWIASR